MVMVDINVGDVPEVSLPLGSGLRTFDITDLHLELNEKHSADEVVVELKVNEPESEEDGRPTFDRMILKFAPARTKFKQLLLAAGHSGQGSLSQIESEFPEIIGTTVKGVVSSRTYVDKDTGKTESASQIKKYVWEE
jgi:hypothetical protein